MVGVPTGVPGGDGLDGIFQNPPPEKVDEPQLEESWGIFWGSKPRETRRVLR